MCTYVHVVRVIIWRYVYSRPLAGYLASIAMLPFRRECPMTQKLVSKKELKSVYGVPYSFAHIARLEAAGQFPTRVRLGACRVAWLSEEVQNWIDERVANRNTTTSS
jgi:prophage regulatory protein